MNKAHVLFFLILIVVYAVVLRSLHLLSSDHFYIISPDSHFFHWQAERVLSGQSIPMTWHGGLTYPLAYSASFLSLVFGVSAGEALTIAGKVLSPALGAVGAAAIFVGTSSMYGRRVGLWAAFAWAIMLYMVYIQTAGYLDRDGLSILLIVLGVFLFYSSSRWRWRVRGKDIGWALGSASVAVVCALLYLEWLWLGPLLLLIVVTAFVIAEASIDLLFRLLDATGDHKAVAGLAKYFLTCVLASVRASSWRPLALVVGLTTTAAMVYPGPSSIWHAAGRQLEDILAGTTGVAELQPLSAEDIFRFGFLLIPLAIGFYIALTRRTRADLLCLSWFVSLFVFALFAKRVFIYAAPAACIISGLGLASVFTFQNVGRTARQVWIGSRLYLVPSLRLLKICGASLLLVGLLAIPTNVALQIGSSGMSSADNAMCSALVYLRENSPSDSVVMTWWDRGYWVLDIADRRPVVDNGFYGWDDQRLEDVALVYCTTQPPDAARLMQKYGADYVIFWTEDVTILPEISKYGLGEPYGDRSSVPEELRESLYYKSLYGSFGDESGLKVIYPSAEVHDPDVVILTLG